MSKRLPGASFARLAIVRVSIVSVSIVVAALVMACGGSRPSDTQRTITVARSFNPSVVPFFVAEEQGYFKSARATIVTKEFVAGRLTLEAVLAGTAQFGTVAETPLANAALQAQPVAVLATFASSSRHVRCLGRRDRGIASVADLKGKRVGAGQGTVQEFRLQKMLSDHGLDPTTVSVVNLQPQDMVVPFVKGDLDAACDWEPFISEMRARVGDKVIDLPADGHYAMNLVANSKTLSADPASADIVLRALAQAADFIRAHPAEAQAIAARRLTIDPKTVAGFWPMYDFSLTLDDRLVSSMTEQAHWSVRRGFHAGKPVPDMRSLIKPEFLKAVDPARVRLP
jgi:NitT/TauT family transport system substrate-binding protein